MQEQARQEQAAPASQASALLDWYDRHGRSLPWRAARGETPDPYRVWLSEIMLQQTTVATVRKRFEAFLERWPTVVDLADASLDDVLHEWQGLGYYARARNLHRCARAVAARPDAAFPETEAGLRELPGIGDYTAAAIAAIAFDAPAAPVDGNVIRVIARFMAIGAEMPAHKGRIKDAVEPMVPPARPGDFAQAMMDLGATVCTPRKPACALCPWRADCRARASGDPLRFPVRPEKKQRPTRFGTVFWVRDSAGRVALRRRPEKGLLGGMMEFPSTGWRDDPWPPEEAAREAARALGRAAGQEVPWRQLPGHVGHTFTHFHLELAVLTSGEVSGNAWPEGWRAVSPEDFPGEALPTVMKKVARFVDAVYSS